MTKKITYKTSGVDISKANAFVRAIKRDVTGTMDSSVIQRKGAFGELRGQVVEGPQLVVVPPASPVGERVDPSKYLLLVYFVIRGIWHFRTVRYGGFGEVQLPG